MTRGRAVHASGKQCLAVPHFDPACRNLVEALLKQSLSRPHFSFSNQLLGLIDQM
jgi:hypothetical protein